MFDWVQMWGLRRRPKEGDATLQNAGMFFSLSLPWWVFPQPDFMVIRGGHRIALFSLCFACLTSNLLCGGRCCHLCHSLLHASLEEEEFIQNRLTGNCPANILPLRGHVFSASSSFIKAAATRRACCERQMARTRALNVRSGSNVGT